MNYISFVYNDDGFGPDMLRIIIDTKDETIKTIKKSFLNERSPEGYFVKHFLDAANKNNDDLLISGHYFGDDHNEFQHEVYILMYKDLKENTDSITENILEFIKSFMSQYEKKEESRLLVLYKDELVNDAISVEYVYNCKPEDNNKFLRENDIEGLKKDFIDSVFSKLKLE